MLPKETAPSPAMNEPTKQDGFYSWPPSPLDGEGRGKQRLPPINPEAPTQIFTRRCFGLSIVAIVSHWVHCGENVFPVGGG
jgi:hypothetical protein